MMKYVKQAIVCLMIALWQYPAAAAPDIWAGARKILYVYPHAGGLVFRLDGARINLEETCEANRMFLPSTAPNYDAIVSSVLLAFASGYDVQVNFDGATQRDCDIVASRVIVSRP